MGNDLAFPLFVEAVVLAVGDDDVVHEVDAHQFTGSLDGFCQFFVGLAGREVAGGVIVADGQDGGIGKYSLTDDDTHIDSRFCDAAV